MGDFNARTGCDRVGVEEYLGHFGDQRNENGCRLLEFCNLHNLFITNTHLNTENHKPIHGINGTTYNVRAKSNLY
jgi:hypothetical protein